MQILDSIDAIDAYVGQRLRQRRIELELGQAYLGSCIGVSFQQIQKYETGANRISASKLAYLSRQLGVPVYYFFQGLPPEYLGCDWPIAPDELFSIPIDFLANPETPKLINLYYAISDKKQREAFLTLLQGIAERQSVEVQDAVSP